MDNDGNSTASKSTIEHVRYSEVNGNTQPETEDSRNNDMNVNNNEISSQPDQLPITREITTHDERKNALRYLMFLKEK